MSKIKYMLNVNPSEMNLSFEGIKAQKYYLYHYKKFEAIRSKFKAWEAESHLLYWNNKDIEIVSTPSFDDLKERIKSHLLSQRRLNEQNLYTRHEEEMLKSEDSNSSMSLTNLQYNAETPQEIILYSDHNIVESNDIIKENNLLNVVKSQEKDQAILNMDVRKDTAKLQEPVEKKRWSCFGGLDTIELNQIYFPTNQKESSSRGHEEESQGKPGFKKEIFHFPDTSKRDNIITGLVPTTTSSMDYNDAFDKGQISRESTRVGEDLNGNNTFVLVDYSNFSSEVQLSSKYSPGLQLSSTMRQSMFDRNIRKFKGDNIVANLKDPSLQKKPSKDFNDHTFARPNPVSLGRENVHSQDVSQIRTRCGITKGPFVIPEIDEGGNHDVDNGSDDDNGGCGAYNTIMDDGDCCCDEDDSVVRYPPKLVVYPPTQSNVEPSFQIYHDSHHHTAAVYDDSVFMNQVTCSQQKLSADDNLNHLDHHQSTARNNGRHQSVSNQQLPTTFAYPINKQDGRVACSYSTSNVNSDNILHHYAQPNQPTLVRPTVIRDAEPHSKPRGLKERKPMQVLSQPICSSSSSNKTLFDTTRVPSYLYAPKACINNNNNSIASNNNNNINNNYSVEPSIIQCYNDTELLGMGVSCYKLESSAAVTFMENKNTTIQQRTAADVAAPEEELLICFDDSPPRAPPSNTPKVIPVISLPLEMLQQTTNNQKPDGPNFKHSLPPIRQTNAPLEVRAQNGAAKRQPLRVIHPSAPSSQTSFDGQCVARQPQDIFDTSRFLPQMNSTTILGRDSSLFRRPVPQHVTNNQVIKTLKPCKVWGEQRVTLTTTKTSVDTFLVTSETSALFENQDRIED